MANRLWKRQTERWALSVRNIRRGLLALPPPSACAFRDLFFQASQDMKKTVEISTFFKPTCVFTQVGFAHPIHSCS